jgi:hypothetical protein
LEKVIVKFIRKGIHFQQTESVLSLELRAMGLRGRERKRETFPIPQGGNGSKQSEK